MPRRFYGIMHDGNCIECISPPITLCIFSRIRSFWVSRWIIMFDALIVAFCSCYNSGMVRWWKNKSCIGLCVCGFSRNTRPRQVFSFENNPVQMNFWIVYMHGYRCIQTDSFFLLLLSNYGHRTWYACGTAKQYTLPAVGSLRRW